MNEPTVAVLVTADHEELLPSTLLFTDTIRVAFPTFNLEVYDNASVHYGAVERAVFDRAKADVFHRAHTRVHHAKWIESMMVSAVERNIDPLVIIDPDCIFWENCEDFKFDHPFAGMYVPPIWNEWANCCSFSRLHTSFLWLRPAEIIQLVTKEVPEYSMPCSEYRPFDSVSPQMVYINKVRYFYDTLSALYQAIGGDFFREEHMRKYDHLNSASFFHHVQFENHEKFVEIHRLAREKPSELKGLNYSILHYYAQMHERAKNMKSLVVLTSPIY